MSKKLTRRESIKILGGGLVFPLSNAMPFIFDSGQHKDIHLFSKHLQWLDYEGMAQAAAKMGFDGVDLTVRPKGHVLPENVERDLPKAVEAIRKEGLKAELFTTSIEDPKDPFTERIIKTAGKLGLKKYRMGWLDYEDAKPIPEQLESFKLQLKELEEMNAHYGVQGDYQNHAGTSVGASVWDIWYLIKDLDPKWLGCQFDIRHAMVEGMHSWEVNLKLLAPHIQMLVLKDFQWKEKDGKWTVENVPFGKGAVDFAKYFKILKEFKIEGPFSLHVEYPLGGANHGSYEISISPKKVMKAIEKDLRNIRAML